MSHVVLSLTVPGLFFILLSMLQEYKGKVRYRRNLSGVVEAYDAESGVVLAVECSPDEWVPSPLDVRIPTVFSRKIADLILQRLEEGFTLTQVLKSEGMPQLTTVLRWVGLNDDFADQIRLARVAYAESIHDTITERAKELLESPASKGELESIKEAFSALKWSAEKQAPERFGSRKVDGVQGGVIIHINTGIDRSPIVEVVNGRQQQDAGCEWELGSIPSEPEGQEAGSTEAGVKEARVKEARADVDTGEESEGIV